MCLFLCLYSVFCQVYVTQTQSQAQYQTELKFTANFDPT